ncbi:hypothetical protein [Sphaerisporangium krabiense]|uniref:Uncharacterized protein n=1 Tax=Sphaerisporangium krabiense TaxID=763782 RepID=A0A7W8Z2I0_9ACTN|nr:hypothetical protein [Sphaerisporangium krabiense]MBB5626234.1 hypothetical protein [Sphaerisporangium krabiense]
MLARRVHEEERNLWLRLNILRRLAGLETTAGRDAFGGPVNHARGNGHAYGAGRDFFLNHFASDGGPHVQSAPMTAEQLGRLKGCLVTTRSQTRLTAMLATEPLVVLRGLPGMGRVTTAMAALQDVTESCHWIMLRDPFRLTTEDLKKRAGYVVNADVPEWTSRPEEFAEFLASMALRKDCRIVLVSADFDLPHRVVDHDPPAAVEVCRATVAYLLRDPDAWERHGLDALDIGQLLSGRRPREAALLAEGLADGVRRGLPVQDVLDAQPVFTRTRFREHLNKDLTRSGHCFLISSAVLHGLPEPAVSSAALELARLIADGTGVEEEPDDGPVWERLRSWLGYSDISAVEGDRPGEGRRVRLREDLVSLLLPMLWEELPGVRPHLYVWLRRLGDGPDEHVRIKVAHAVGLLATCDFDLVQREFLDGWSRDRKPARKQLAAWALEAAAGAPGLSGRVDRLLREWAEYGPYERLATAAIAYGSPTRVRDLGDALDTFERITRVTRRYWLCDAVARSVADIYAPDTARPVVGALARWARGEAAGGRLAAALALVRLGGPRPGARPVLLDHGDDEDLIALWSRSLELTLSSDRMAGRGSSLSGRLWELFTAWVGAWEECPSLRPVVAGVLLSAGQGEVRLRRTYQLYLLLWRRTATVSGELFDHLNRILKDW